MSYHLESLLTKQQRLQAEIGDSLQRTAMHMNNLRALRVGQYLHDNAAPADPDEIADDMVMCIEEAERSIGMARRLLSEAVGLTGSDYTAKIDAARSLMTEASGYLQEDK